MFKSYDLYRIKIYSPAKALLILREKHIPVRGFRSVESYTYEFSVSPKYRREIEKTFSEAVLIERYGPLALGYNLIRKKTTVIAALFALIFFCVASTRIYGVTFTGGSLELDRRLEERLADYRIARYQALPNHAKLAEVQKTLEQEFVQSLEFLEVKRTGLIVEVRYEKRREAIVLPVLERTLVARRDGVIAKILVAHGEKRVQVNDYVQPGTVLIAAEIAVGDLETLEIFAKGTVMAYTWRRVTVELETTGREEGEMLAALLNTADREALADAVEGSIDERNILSFDYGEVTSKLSCHYTLLENIAVESAEEQSENLPES